MMIRAEQENNIRAAYNLVIFLILFSFQVSFLSHLERRSGDFIDVFYSTKVPLRGLKIKTICENTVDFCSVCADFMVDDLVRIHCGPCLSTGGEDCFPSFQTTGYVVYSDHSRTRLRPFRASCLTREGAMAEALTRAAEGGKTSRI